MCLISIKYYPFLVIIEDLYQVHITPLNFKEIPFGFLIPEEIFLNLVKQNSKIDEQMLKSSQKHVRSNELKFYNYWYFNKDAYSYRFKLSITEGND